MSYCSKCGVKVDSNVKKCPLCNIPIHHFDNSPSSGNYPERKNKASMTNKQIRTLTWHILSLIFTISFLIVLSVDLVINSKITWSGYPMTGIGAAWLITTFILLFLRKPLIIVIGNSFSILCCLLLIDIFDGNLNWFLQLGLPIWGMVTAIVVTIFILIITLKNPGAEVTGIAFILIGFFCIGLELLVSAFMGNISLKWSFIVLSIMLPLGSFLIIYHYALRKKYDLSKVFHI